MKQEERRDIGKRAAVVRRVINDVIGNPSVTLSIETLGKWLDISSDGAGRILRQLVASGLVREIQTGVWARATLPGGRDWY